MTRQRTNPTMLLVGLAVSAVCLWLALRGQDLESVARSLRVLDMRLVLPFLAVLFLYYWLKALRWTVLLRPLGRVPAKAAFPLVIISYTASIVLPMQLGEVVKAWLAARRFGMKVVALLASIFVERILDLATVLLVFGVTAVAVPSIPAAMRSAGFIAGLAAAAALAACALIAAFEQPLRRLLARPLSALPTAAGEALLRMYDSAAAGLQALRHPALFLNAFANSLMQWLAMWACVQLSLSAAGITAGPAASLLAMIFTVVGLTLPTSPGSIGTIQLAFVLALRPFGVPSEAAFAASVFFHVLAYLSVLFAGLFYLQRDGIRLTALRDEAAAQDR